MKRTLFAVNTAAFSVIVGALVFACGGSSVTVDDSADATSTSSEAGTSETSTSSDAGSLSDVPVPSDKFSFFVTSFRGLQELSGSADGFGGDLRFGETGAGAGLRGADKICATLAEKSLPGAGNKPWRAFLSAVEGEDGKQVNAIDRIGSGPWYDRLGRLLAPTKADLLFDRPQNGDSTIKDDFPNEDGVPNHQPDPTKAAVDNHDMLTGSDTSGKLYAADATCLSWTSAIGDRAKEGKPRVGHSWPRQGGPGGGGGGGGPGGMGSGANWMSSLTESGCKAGANLVEMGGPQASAVTVGSGGGYGGFYCFSLVP